MKKQCPWCGRLGQRFPSERDIWGRPELNPHADGSPCICRHINSASRLSALRDGGRYWDGTAWVCPSCGTAPPATEKELDLLSAAEDKD